MPIKDIAISAVSSSVFLIPMIVLVCRLGLVERNRGVCYYLFSVYLCVVYWLTGPPDITYFRWDPAVVFVPFADMAGDLRSTVLNIALFLPLGIGLPLLWRRYHSLWRTVLFGSWVSLGIEILQLFTYRATDVNDLITNVTGTVIGYIVYKLCLPKTIAGSRNDAPLLLGISCAVMFFGEPFLHGVLYGLL